MWMLAHLVDCHMQGQRRISLLDYIYFMQRGRWKADSRPTRRTTVGNYLTSFFGGRHTGPRRDTRWGDVTRMS